MGSIGIREGNLAARGGNLLIRVSEFEMRHPDGQKAVLSHGTRPEEADPLDGEERELRARLEAIERTRRERRTA